MQIEITPVHCTLNPHLKKREVQFEVHNEDYTSLPC